MKEKVLLTYPHAYDKSSHALVATVGKEIEAAGFEVVLPPDDRTTGAKLRHCMRSVRAVVALYLPTKGMDGVTKTSSWPEATVGAARAGVGAELDCIVITQKGIDNHGLAKNDQCLITTAYDPNDEQTLTYARSTLRERLLAIQNARTQCTIWVLNFDLAGFTAQENEHGQTVPALNEELERKATEAKLKVSDIIHRKQVIPDHVIDTGDGGYFIFQSGNGADAKFVLDLAREIRSAFSRPTDVHIALSAGAVTRCYSISGGLTYIGHPMNAAARVNDSDDGSIHVEDNFLAACNNTAEQRELLKLRRQKKEAKHGQIFHFRKVGPEAR